MRYLVLAAGLVLAGCATPQSDKAYVAAALNIPITDLDCRLRIIDGGTGGAYSPGSRTVMLGSRARTSVRRHEWAHCAINRNGPVPCLHDEYLAYRVAGLGERAARQGAERSCGRMRR